MKTRLITFFALFIMFMSCAVQVQTLVSKQNKVEVGMTKDEVLDLMGEPGNRQIKGTYEAWQYCATNYSVTGNDHYTTIWLNKGVVYSLTSYKATHDGNCENFYKKIEWNAPDKTIEYRKR